MDSLFCTLKITPVNRDGNFSSSHRRAKAKLSVKERKKIRTDGLGRFQVIPFITQWLWAVLGSEAPCMVHIGCIFAVMLSLWTVSQQWCYPVSICYTLSLGPVWMSLLIGPEWSKVTDCVVVPDWSRVEQSYWLCSSSWLVQNGAKLLLVFWFLIDLEWSKATDCVVVPDWSRMEQSYWLCCRSRFIQNGAKLLILF